MPPPPPPPSRRNEASNKASAASKEENIYIPNFISKRPFYASEEGDQNDYLEHQRIKKPKEDENKSEWYDRGKKAGPAATKWRKGACENCGAMGHKRKECMERPRKIGAKWSGKDIQADRVVKDFSTMGSSSWDAKRDRWNGYDPNDHRRVIERYDQMDELRQRLSQKNKEDDGEDDQDAGDRYAEESDMGRHQPTATRSLRIREDTAKYLLNLDLESAKYDPKTRTMVDAGATADKAAALFAEEGFQRASGDAEEFEKAQRYAWEAQEKMGDTRQHMQANPTAGEFHRRKEKEEAEQRREAQRKALQDKYGGEEHTMPSALRDVAVIESEQFVEYDEAGLIKGAPRASATSKYAEDVYANNHTSVWGSWWSSFRWGYACCHSFIKNSYCTGEEGKLAWEAAERQRMGVELAGEGEAKEPYKETQQTTEGAGEPRTTTAKKRTMEEMMGGVTEAELDEYRRKRTAADDPMAKYIGTEELSAP
ncbi:Pre-mRNA splicing Prp18-interacting factor-domain-containing protein [Xylariomycetidae sp. FL2044]|nr:Pre-mRNA splicing Prp18-interacting factor-domain-containing protein [Xylariomycetidae sp. FL2044]